jgi:hypothetical protein
MLTTYIITDLADEKEHSKIYNLSNVLSIIHPPLPVPRRPPTNLLSYLLVKLDYQGISIVELELMAMC